MEVKRNPHRPLSNEPQESLSLKLAELRSRLNMTQRELADEFYVTPGAVAHWENGIRAIPGPVKRLMEIYETAVEGKRGLGKR